MEFVKTYAKSLLAVLATILVAVSTAWNGGITSGEWITVALAAGGAVAVFAAPNVPGARYTKSILAVVMAVLTAAQGFVTASGSIGGEQWLQLIVVALGALGVFAVGNYKNGVNLSDTGSVGVDGTEGP